LIISQNKCVKFQLKTPKGCSENTEKHERLLYFAAPCTLHCRLKALLTEMSTACIGHRDVKQPVDYRRFNL